MRFPFQTGRKKGSDTMRKPTSTHHIQSRIQQRQTYSPPTKQSKWSAESSDRDIHSYSLTNSTQSHSNTTQIKTDQNHSSIRSNVGRGMTGHSPRREKSMRQQRALKSRRIQWLQTGRGRRGSVCTQPRGREHIARYSALPPARTRDVCESTRISVYALCKCVCVCGNVSVCGVWGRRVL
jgi:hypothetical protein